MKNPFTNRAADLSGPTNDILPITPDDGSDLQQVAAALYVTGGGTVAMVTERGETRTVEVTDFAILPVGVRRVLATGTTATGLHALVFA